MVNALLLLSAVLAQPGEQHAAVSSAQATVRIVRAAAVHVGNPSTDPAAVFRLAVVRIDGQMQPARLVEFR